MTETISGQMLLDPPKTLVEIKE